MRVIGTAMAGVALVAACSSPPPARPDNREAAYRENNRGVAELEQYAYDKAIESFRRAIALDNRVALPYLNLAIALYYASNLDESQRVVDAAESKLSNSPHVAFLRGLIARAASRPADAEAAFKRVLALDADDAASMVNLGQIYLQDRKATEAIAMLRTAVAREPSNASARYALGQALIRNGARHEGARETGRFEALRDSGAGVTYSQTYLEQGHYAEALVSTGLEPDLVSRDIPSVRFSDQTAGWVGPGPIAVSATSQGSFQASLGASANGTATTIVLSDVDVDGDLDLLVGHRHGVTLLKWNNGRFSEEASAARLLEPRPVNGIVIGDLDNDNRPDLVTVLDKRLSIRRQTASGAFDLFPRQPAMSINGETAALLDADHDGDLDVLVGGRAASSNQSGLALFRNDGQGRFSDVTSTAKLTLSGRPLAVVPIDFDNRRDVDIAVMVEGRAAALFQNQRDGSFRDVAAGVGLLEFQGSSLTSCDLNKDGFSDVVAAGSARVKLAMSDGHGRFRAQDGPESSAGIVRVQCADYDNDGLLDIIGAGAGGIRVLRNVGRELIDVTVQAIGEDARAVRSINAMSLGDIDGDGDVDVAFIDAAGTVRLMRNDGGSAHPSVRVALKGRVSNRSGVGARVDVRAGSLWQRLDRLAVTPPAAPENPSIGLGEHEAADAIRVLWPAGILQAEADLQPNVATITELDRKPSSCPFLYTWNGQSFEFITDFLGGGELGYWEGPGLYNHPDPDEFVRITETQLRPRNGRLELRVTNELEEVLYLDHVRVISIDHPTDVEIYPREGMRVVAARGLDLIAVRKVRPVSRAWSDRGEDLTAQLASRDGSFATGFVPRSIRGYAEAHDLTFELPASAGASRAQALLLTGWTDYAFSSDNVAASQRGWTMDPPRLEVRAGDGAWRLIDADVGIPVGRSQTLVVKLGEVANGSQFRLRTNMRIHWDALAIADIASDVDLTPRVHPLIRADLHWRGFSAIDDSIAPRPAIPDYQRVSTSSPWKVFPGRYTREGDVRALVADADDLPVVARTGDEIALVFDALPKATGHVTYLLGGFGFSKEMDVNSASPDVVLPLPARGLTHYPSVSPSAETRARQHEMLQRYNTRVVARSIPSLTTREP